MAYGKIYRNNGAMTPGVTQETVDEMSLRKIDTIREALQYERYRWTPVRRIYIEKKNSTKMRPLGLPTWSDKLLQEVIRIILEAYYEPQFSEQSHGFRPDKGCQTALKEIYTKWTGTTWFIEGDIKGCFDNIDHEILLSTIAEKIHDGRFIRLIRELLQAGYMENWKYNATHSGSPQGGIVSPILANIYLNKLDKFVETTLIPTYTQGDKRRRNPKYRYLTSVKRPRAIKAGRIEQAQEVLKEAQKMPSIDPNDPTYRRLRFVRYADDFLLGFSGSKEEAEEIKSELRQFLLNELKLELSENKTLITHAKTEAAKFLGYEILMLQEDTARVAEGVRKGHRKINAKVALRVPERVVREKCQEYMRNGKPTHRRELLDDTPFSIIARYQMAYRGLVEYYRLAYNIYTLHQLKWIMEQSLVKTLAFKLKTTVSKVYRKFRTTFDVDGKPYKGLQVIIDRGEGRKPLIAQWGGIPLTRKTVVALNDSLISKGIGRTELVKRLLAEECELCGSQEKIEVHHIRALKDLKKYGEERPAWAKIMAIRQRKTLILCQACHVKVHQGKINQTWTR
jgi:group II intron reverse transcriptase/maturase